MKNGEKLLHEKNEEEEEKRRNILPSTIGIIFDLSTEIFSTFFFQFLMLVTSALG